jgi:hypothetical protein
VLVKFTVSGVDAKATDMNIDKIRVTPKASNIAENAFFLFILYIHLLFRLIRVSIIIEKQLSRKTIINKREGPKSLLPQSSGDLCYERGND